jgi:hypothetical protein
LISINVSTLQTFKNWKKAADKRDISSVLYELVIFFGEFCGFIFVFPSMVEVSFFDFFYLELFKPSLFPKNQRIWSLRCVGRS